MFLFSTQILYQVYNIYRELLLLCCCLLCPLLVVIICVPLVEIHLTSTTRYQVYRVGDKSAWQDQMRPSAI